MSTPKIIVVFGATGNQGGSVVNEFLGESGWQVRAITRNTASPKAQALVSRGAQVVNADIDKPDTLPAALEGANAVFAVSDFWGVFGDPANKDKPQRGQSLNAWAGEHETWQLKGIIDAVAKLPDLERFILSSLSNSTKWSKGKYTHVYHFDSKARAAEYAQATYPDLWEKTSIFQAGFFLSNFVSNPMTKVSKDEDGVVQFIGHIEPDVKLPFIAADEDTGPVVKQLVLTEPAKKNIIAYREWLTPEELAATFTQATGMKAKSVTLPKGYFPAPLPEALKQELEDNFACFNEFGYEARDDPTLSHPRDLQSPPAFGSVVDYWKKQDWSKVFA
ncbi:hypothetical protein F5X68DRAFT_204137 [Plectosphaerella plurivora]|uniref:NmrA-like domain-containing protein n=1 Tax=Plectosphaerella plurivora TaxID=936078 RepID=A0A9P9ABY7_9PEZI|nr:hypothetical protein F5X68DRAFT_204137 [Plectosphaerella plurivora]